MYGGPGADAGWDLLSLDAPRLLTYFLCPDFGGSITFTQLASDYTHGQVVDLNYCGTADWGVLPVSYFGILFVLWHLRNTFWFCSFNRFRYVPCELKQVFIVQEQTIKVYKKQI